MADSSLLIKISAESAEFDKAVDGIKEKTASLEANLAGVAKTAGVAFAAIQAAAGVAIHAYGESEKASKELTLALQNQGIASTELAAKYDELATAIQKKTGIDDDAVKSGFAVLQGFIGQQEISGELADSLVNLAEKTGSVESAAEILGRGIQGNVRGLKQFGIEIDDSLSKEERLAKITQEVTTRFGGLAEANGKGVGSIRGLQNAFGNFIEQIGKRLTPSFEAATLTLTKFFQSLEENGPLIDFIVEAGKIAAIITGAVAAAGSFALAVVKVRDAMLVADAAMKILGLSTRALVGATGIGLLLIVAYELYANWNKIWPAMQSVYSTFANNVAAIAEGLGDILLAVIIPGPQSIAKIKEGYSKLKGVFQEGIKSVQDAAKNSGEIGDGITQSPEKRAAADKAADDSARKERARLATIGAERQLAVLEAEKASDDVINLKKKEIEILKKLEDEKYKDQREQLTRALLENAILQEDARATETEQLQSFNENLILKSKEYQDLSYEQQVVFLAKNQAAIQASQLTENTARQKVIADELKFQVESNNKRLVEQQKYGTAVAVINQTINSNEVKGFEQTTGQLTALSSSKNATLKSIGKAAAVADITVRTARGAIAAYTGFIEAIPFPPVAIPLGIAAAGAVIAYGAEQIGNVVTAQKGGIVPGFNTGGDSVPSLLQAGEGIVPRASFDEVVDAVASRRAQETTQATSGVATGGGGGGTQVAVNLQFSGDGAEKFLTARRVEARSLGTLREATA